MNKRMTRAFILLILLFSVNCAEAQFNETIRTGRPGQTIGPYSVGNRILQIQQGIDLYGSDAPDSPNILLSNNVVRYGVSEDVEISALIDYQNERIMTDTQSVSLRGLSNLHVGFRVHLTDQKGWLPTTGIQLRIRVPEISSEFGVAHFAPITVFVANWSLPKKMGLCTNWSWSYNGNDSDAIGRYAVNFSFPIYKKWSGFVENYAQLRRSIFDLYFDGGLAFLANNNVQLDLYAGYGDNGGIRSYFVSTGISWRLINL